MVPESHRRLIETRLNAAKAAQGLGAELKWTKISEAWADKYIAFIDEVFDCMDEGMLRMRVMFTQNSNKPTGLSDYQLENQYFLLYYQLIKHAFGLMHCHQPQTTRPSTTDDETSVDPFGRDAEPPKQRRQLQVLPGVTFGFPELSERRSNDTARRHCGGELTSARDFASPGRGDGSHAVPFERHASGEACRQVPARQADQG